MKIPVLILTGFLGAGKTTVLKKILAAESYGDSAVLINEFGEVGIDQQLVEPVSPNVVLLDSGCICCQIRGELKETLASLLDRRAQGLLPPFRRIIIETTGLAEPTPIIATLQADPMLCHQLAAERTVTVVDAVNGDAMRGNPVWLQQVSAADIILISKSDLAPARAEALAASLRALLPGITILRHGLDDSLPDFSALPVPAFRAKSAAPQGVMPDVHSLALTLDEPLDWIAFSVWLSALLHVHGTAILRIKGILDIGEDYPVLINGVQHMIYPPQHLGEWPAGKRQSQLVIISQGIAADTMEKSFRYHVVGAAPDGRPAE
ncbi:MAG: GTP-binding protein [Cardiobacteriaceae bacterium]|nr:GTP-binding protein [Cardiobacteriaceae bacterium]